MRSRPGEPRTAPGSRQLVLTPARVNRHPALAFSSKAGLAFPTSSLPVGSAVSTVYAIAGAKNVGANVDSFATVLSWGVHSADGARGLIRGRGTTPAFADTLGEWRLVPATPAWKSGRTQITRYLEQRWGV